MKPLLFFILGFLSVAHAQDAPPSSSAATGNIDPSALIAKVLAAYKALDTYSSNGTVVVDGQMKGAKVQIKTTFTIKLKKPNLYLITWDQQNGALDQAGTVWNDGTQAYLYTGVSHAYSKMANDETALAASTGISGGAAFTIPSFFLPIFADKGARMSRLKDPVIEKSEPVGSEDCYVLSGSSNVSEKETYWIAKSSDLILKYERSLTPPAGGVKFPELSDADLEKSLTATGQAVTEENKKRMRDMMAHAQSMLKNSDSSGTVTETQLDISHPTFTATNFQFTPPEGATLTDSMFGTKASSPQPIPGPGGSKGGYETVDATVIKVFSATDGDNKFIAYLVKWKGAEIIVTDPLSRSNYKVGDSIQFLAQKINGPGYSSLAFTLLN